MKNCPTQEAVPAALCSALLPSVSAVGRWSWEERDSGWLESCDSLIATGRLLSGQDSDRWFLAPSCYRPNSKDSVFQA